MDSSTDRRPVHTHTPTLDCQDCGRVLRKLTPAEAQRVAYRPYSFIVFCNDCAPNQPGFLL
ncbi:hypothetical protein [Agromyces humi]|uniref:hypothetical protein n=1 Tax=Agromyces humi TaxID=1766800 RepID=UPI001359F830|nr:hypothetical protein [Agromyces humi]